MRAYSPVDRHSPESQKAAKIGLLLHPRRKSRNLLRRLHEAAIS